ncbi:endonuclease/exonuclease/phosphatase family protein [Nonomuraea thailandensis]
MTVRVGTYNLHGLRDSLPALTRVMAAARADVLCVQEAPRFGRWRARRAALAAAAGLAVATPDRAGEWPSWSGGAPACCTPRATGCARSSAWNGARWPSPWCRPRGPGWPSARSTSTSATPPGCITPPRPWR